MKGYAKGGTIMGFNNKVALAATGIITITSVVCQILITKNRLKK